MPDEARKAAPLATAGSDGAFLRRLALVLLAAAAGIAAWLLLDLLLLAFGAILLALALRGVARTLSRRIPVREAWLVAPIVVALLAAVGGVFWLFGTQIATQFDLLAADLPQSISLLLHDLAGRAWGAWLLARAQELNLTTATGQLAGRVAMFFGSVFRVLAYLGLLLFAAVYLAAQPERYRQGLLRLVPPERRRRIGEVLDLMGATLERWMIGQCLTMAILGTLIAIGLWLLGVRAPIALGLIAGMLAFVPYVGPVLAALPGILMAATAGPMAALYAAALYGGVHFVEGNLITPLVQAEAVELPPVLTIFAAFGFGLVLGPVGVLLSAPLTVTLLVAVNALYIEDALGERRSWPTLPVRSRHG